MGNKSRKITITGTFEDKRNPIAKDLRTPKYRKRVEENKKAKDRREGSKMDYDRE